MPQSEFRSWLAEYQIEPFGERREDLRIANLAKAIALILRPNSDPDINAFLLNFKKNDSTLDNSNDKKSPKITAHQLQAIYGGEIRKT